MEIYFRKYSSPAGELLLVVSDAEVLMCDWIVSRRHQDLLRRILDDVDGGASFVEARDGCCLMNRLIRELDEYFDRLRTNFTLPVRFVGTPFRKTVWGALKRLEYGSIVSYGELALQCGVAASVRAVASAVAVNPISILVPCHRVVRAGGVIGDYAGGADAKKLLIELERRHGH